MIVTQNQFLRVLKETAQNGRPILRLVPKDYRTKALGLRLTRKMAAAIAKAFTE